MEHNTYPDVTKELAAKRRELAPEIYAAFRTFGQRVFADGALPSKTKQLIAVAVAHVTQCPYCIRGHTALAMQKGATEQELMEAHMGRRRNARRWRIRAFDPGHRRDASDRRDAGCVSDAICDRSPTLNSSGPHPLHGHFGLEAFDITEDRGDCERLLRAIEAQKAVFCSGCPPRPRVRPISRHGRQQVDLDVAVLAPEERNVGEFFAAPEHVDCGGLPLALGNNPVFDAN